MFEQEEILFTYKHPRSKFLSNWPERRAKWLLDDRIADDPIGSKPDKVAKGSFSG
jgi:hypothetical protein